MLACLLSGEGKLRAASSTMAAVVRLGRRDEACHLLEMIRELAVFENELDQVKMTEATLMQDGWPLPEAVAAGAVPRFLVLFAEVDGALVGFALFYNNYSTWEGLGMYLEDLYVKKDFRGRGVGTQLIRRVPEVDSSCRLLIVPLFRGSSRFESLVLSHHSRFNVTCECNTEEINDDDDAGGGVVGAGRTQPAGAWRQVLLY